MLQLSDLPRLYLVRAIADEADGCIRVTVASDDPGQDSETATVPFCDANEVTVVRAAHQKQGYIGLSSDGAGVVLTPATVAITLELRARDEQGGLRLMAPPRPMLMTVAANSTKMAEALSRAAQAGHSAVLVLQGSAQITDYRIIDRDTALRLLGMRQQL